MIQPQNITEYYINTFINPGDCVIDATAGNGFDTLKLCRAVGEDGKVYAFDIQECALDATGKKLEENGFSNAKLVKASHSEIDKYVKENVKAVVFNLGYLPGGDHSLQTKAGTTIEAIKKSLEILSDTGFVSVTVYYGKNSGSEEKILLWNILKILTIKNIRCLCTIFITDRIILRLRLLLQKIHNQI